MGYRTSNASPKQHQFQGAVPAYVEMAALEDLGPCARHALLNLPLPILAAPVISKIVEHNDKIEKENERRQSEGWLLPQIPYLDPKHPAVDQKIAQSLIDMACGLLRLDNVAEIDVKASLRPLVGRPSPKSLREQRRARRIVRW